MYFQWPFMLWLLLLIPGLIVAYIIAQRRRQKYALRFASLSLVKEALGRGPGWRRHIPPLIFLLALAVMILAMARPIAVVALPTQEGTVILTFDVSGSMMADDMKPTRMEAAKAAARAFVDKQPPGVLIGVVSFSDNASIIQTPTDDKTAVLAAINRLQPQRATAIGRGLLASIDAIYAPGNEEATFGQRFQRGFPQITPTPTPTPTPVPKGQFEPAIIVLLSDGENNVFPPPLQVVDQLVNRGIRVYTVGVGTPAGTILHVEGRSVRVRLDETTLKEIAQQTDGQYYNAANESDLRTIYENLATRLVVRSEKQEITFALTAVAGLLSLIAGFLSLLWFNRLP
jgi:Ca-activated chloride channel family protein